MSHCSLTDVRGTLTWVDAIEHDRFSTAWQVALWRTLVSRRYAARATGVLGGRALRRVSGLLVSSPSR